VQALAAQRLQLLRRALDHELDQRVRVVLLVVSEAAGGSASRPGEEGKERARDARRLLVRALEQRLEHVLLVRLRPCAHGQLGDLDAAQVARAHALVHVQLAAGDEAVLAQRRHLALEVLVERLLKRCAR